MMTPSRVIAVAASPDSSRTALHRPCLIVGTACCKPAHSCRHLQAMQVQTWTEIKNCSTLRQSIAQALLHSSCCMLQASPLLQAFAQASQLQAPADSNNKGPTAVHCPRPVCMLQLRPLPRAQNEMWCWTNRERVVTCGSSHHLRWYEPPQNEHNVNA
jgi:hypothetical protein